MTPSARDNLLFRGCALLAVAIWGWSFTGTRMVIVDVPPAALVMSRCAIGSAFLFALALMLGQRPSRRHLASLALLSFVGVFLHQLLQATGMQTAMATTAGVLIAVIPAWTALLGVFFLRERLTVVQIAGIALGALGVLVVVTGGFRKGLDLSSVSAGDAFVLGSTVLWAVYTILVRIHSAGVGSLTGTATMLAMAALMFAPLVDWHTAAATFGGLSGTQYAALAGLGLGASGAAFWLWSIALKHVPSSEIAATLYAEPVFAAIAASLVLGESITPALLFGGVLIVTGVVIVQRRQT